MTVQINGRTRDVPDGLTVAELLALLELRSDGVAVAVDREVVPRSAFASTRIEDGQRIDVLRAVGGG